MSDGIAKGVGEQFGQLGQQIIKDIASVPAKITGLDVGTNEGVTSGSAKQNWRQQKQITPKPSEKIDPILVMKQKDEIERQKQLAEARKLLEQLINPQQQTTPSIREQIEMEEMEKKKKEIEEEKKKAKKQLPLVATRAKRGNLFGIKSKQFAGEVGKNVKSQ